MNDAESLRDYLIADEIQRIQSMTHEALVAEMIELLSRRLESASLTELLSDARLKTL